MGQMMQVGILIGIVGSACCFLIGCVMTSIRFVKLALRERALLNKSWADWQVGKADFYKTDEDAETVPKCAVITRYASRVTRNGL